jgi:hypothetical protein
MEMGMGEFYLKFSEDAKEDICLIIYTSFWVIA